MGTLELHYLGIDVIPIGRGLNTCTDKLTFFLVEVKENLTVFSRGDYVSL